MKDHNRSDSRPSLPRVLAVDDEPDVLSALSRTLRGKFDLVTVTSGLEGLRTLHGGEDFAVILSDMRMPEMNGVEFLASAKTISPKSVTMMLTGYADKHTAKAAVDKGEVFHFLVKPCEPEYLLRAISAAVKLYDLQMQISEIGKFLRSVA